MVHYSTQAADLTGQVFGQLTVLRHMPSGRRRSWWECQCDCGVRKIIATCDLRAGHVLSCGCRKNSRRHDYTGRVFGRLLVIREAPRRSGKVCWECRCECGAITVVRMGNLQSGNTQSCGCLQIDRSVAAFTTHGLHDHPLYHVWDSMIQRCENPRDRGYYKYGQRGISVCSEWRHEAGAFINWALEHGYSRDLSIDRIDVNGNYEPSNCRYADAKTQVSNRRPRSEWKTPVYRNAITAFGESKTAAAWAQDHRAAAASGTIRYRITVLRWSPEAAISTPPQKPRRKRICPAPKPT